MPQFHLSFSSHVPAASSLLVLPARHWEALEQEVVAQLHSADYWKPAGLDKPAGAAEVRSLIQFAARSPVGSLKVALLPWAERMNQESANALLKLLEEPPVYLSLLLLGEQPSILPTIRSRVRLLPPAPEFATIQEQVVWSDIVATHSLEDKKNREWLRSLLYMHSLTHQSLSSEQFVKPFRPNS